MKNLLFLFSFLLLFSSCSKKQKNEYLDMNLLVFETKKNIFLLTNSEIILSNDFITDSTLTPFLETLPNPILDLININGANIIKEYTVLPLVRSYKPPIGCDIFEYETYIEGLGLRRIIIVDDSLVHRPDFF